MATTSIQDAAGSLISAELVQSLSRDLGRELSSMLRPGASSSTQMSQTAGKPGAGNDRQQAMPAADVSTLLFGQVATSDLSKLTTILDPDPDGNESSMLDSLLRMAIQEVKNDNPERAVGYLADYATRDPKRGESLASDPALEPVRDQIDSMLNRMTTVAKISAENGLSIAERTISEIPGKLPTWDTNGDVLLKLAHRLFEAGGYANYSRSAELARAVTDAGAHWNQPPVHALAASASASSAHFVQPNQIANEMIPGIDVPYWTQPLDSAAGPTEIKAGRTIRKVSAAVFADACQNLRDLRTIAGDALRQLWQRAPLLVMLMTWLGLGLPWAVAYAICNHFWPNSLAIAIANLAFALWGLGFLALVGFGFYFRIRYRSLRP